MRKSGHGKIMAVGEFGGLWWRYNEVLLYMAFIERTINVTQVPQHRAIV